MSVAFTPFYCLAQDMSDKVHNFNSDTFNWMFSNVAPVLTNAVKTDITEITAQNGYSAGGFAVPSTTNSQTLGVDTFTGSTATATASGGSFGPLQYAVLYNATASGKNLVGYVNYGSAITITAPETISLTTPSGIFTLTV